MSIGERIRLEREAQGMDRNELAARAGMPYPTLAGIENKDQGSSTKLHALAAALGVNPRWLETGKGPKYPQEAGMEDHVPILAYAQAAGLSEGEEAQEYAETHRLKFRADSLARKRLKPGSLAVFYGKGDSMEPRIRTGDAVLFDLSDTRPKDGHLFVITVPGAGADSYSIKRCEMLDDLVLFKADNPSGDHNWKKPRRMDDPKKPIKIIGRVRWIGSWEG